MSVNLRLSNAAYDLQQGLCESPWGVVLAASLGLASLGTGMGLTASHSSSSDGSVPSSVPIASASVSTIPTLSSSTLGLGSTSGSTSLVSSAISPDYFVGPGGGSGSGEAYYSSYSISVYFLLGHSFGGVATHICNSLPPDSNSLDLACQAKSGTLGTDMANYYINHGESFPNVIVYYTINDYVSFDVY